MPFETDPVILCLYAFNVKIYRARLVSMAPKIPLVRIILAPDYLRKSIGEYMHDKTFLLIGNNRTLITKGVGGE